MSKIHIVFGPQGAGKSTYAKQLSREVKAVHLSLENWMWKLYKPDLPNPMSLEWIMERVDRCEKQIWSTSKKILACGCDVILDLGFTKLAKRKLFLSLAERLNISTQLHYVNAPHFIRRKRVLERKAEKGETFPFEVSPKIFDLMEKEFEKPMKKELIESVLIDTSITVLYPKGI